MADRDAVDGRHGGDLPVRHQPEETFTYRFVVDKVTDLQLLITDHPIVPECSCHEIN